jgi:hypothetical protein
VEEVGCFGTESWLHISEGHDLITYFGYVRDCGWQLLKAKRESTQHNSFIHLIFTSVDGRQVWIVLSSLIIYKFSLLPKYEHNYKMKCVWWQNASVKVWVFWKVVTLRHIHDWRWLCTLNYSCSYSSSTVSWHTTVYLTNYQENLQFQTGTGIWSRVTLRHKENANLGSSNTRTAGSNIDRHMDVLWFVDVLVRWYSGIIDNGYLTLKESY